MMQFNSADALLEKPEFDRGFKLTTWQTYSHNMSCSLPYKAIVFSQFLEHIHVIESQVGCPEETSQFYLVTSG